MSNTQNTTAELDAQLNAQILKSDILVSAGPLCAGAMQARNWGEHCMRYDTRAESVAQLRPTQNWC